MAVSLKAAGFQTQTFPLLPAVPSPGSGSNDLMTMHVSWRTQPGVTYEVAGPVSGWTMLRTTTCMREVCNVVYYKIGTLSAGTTVSPTWSSGSPLAGVAWINIWQCGASETWDTSLITTTAEDGYYGSDYNASYFYGNNYDGTFNV